MCFLSFADDVTVTEVNVFVKWGEMNFFGKKEKEVANLSGTIGVFRLRRVLTMPSALFEAAPTSELKCCAAAFVFKGIG